MTNKLFILTALLLLVSFFSSAVFAQTVPGGGSEDLIYTFKNNNGNGTCAGDAQINVAFTPIPDPNHIPKIMEIWYDDGKSKKQIITIFTPVYGYMINKTQPYVSYCLHGLLPSDNSKGNVAPGIKLTLVFETQ